MIRTVLSVIRGEGVRSAITRAGERVAQAFLPVPFGKANILNYCAMSVAPRNGGVAVQLQARMRIERRYRRVALYSGPHVRDAMKRSGATLLHIEGTFGVEEVVQPYIVSVHDMTATPELLANAERVIFPSAYLRDAYRIDGDIIEPGIDPVRVHGGGDGIAYAGSVKQHKGAHLLPEIARLLGKQLHVFGGGDEELFRELRRVPNIVIHGYYRAGTLPRLLARHRIGTVIIPSIVPESFSLVLSEAWMAGAAVVAFDHGAIAERIRREGGGWVVKIEEGAEGLVKAIGRAAKIPEVVTAEQAAKRYLELYSAAGAGE